MICEICNTDCNAVIPKNKKFCEDCKCSYLSHYNFEDFDKLSSSIMTTLCNINKNMGKNLEETNKLAKTFGVLWLPIGIQPSEVDRFLKYFPANSCIREALFLKSKARYIEIQLLMPILDRSCDAVIFITSDKAKDRCETFFSQRKEINIDVGRLDHLDVPEGKLCNVCLEIISFGEMCVLLPRQFHKENMVWHPNCFKCTHCQHFLIDYIFGCDDRDESGPYCLRHFDDRFFPRCTNCDELIFEDNYASVLDDCFHIDHFRCYICDKLLVNTQFILESGNSNALKLWKCVSCINVPSDMSCFVCQEKIDESKNDTLMADGLRAHKQCFCCQLCQESLSMLDLKSYVKEANQIFCLNCHNSKLCNRCPECKEVLDLNEKNKVGNGNIFWHRQCLKCSLCDKNIREADNYTIIDNKNKISRATKPNNDNACAICKPCFINNFCDTCEICHKLIHDEGVKYQSKLFHKSCFRCYKCLSYLDGSKFINQDDQFYCISCYSQKFCNSCFGCKAAIFATESDCKMVNFETRFWHESCFSCTFCNKSLLEAGFLFDDDCISCIDCGVK